MSGADENVKSTLKKPLFCAEWNAVIPDEGQETLSPKFYLKSIQCEFKLTLEGNLWLDVIRSDGLDITECFRCTAIALSELDLKSPPVRKRIEQEQENFFCLWDIDLSDLNDPHKIRGKTISFLVVIEEDGESTQEQEADCDWSLSPKSLHSLCGDFAKLLDDPQTADVKLLCGDLTIPAHKTILSARSEVFQKMLQTDMLEKRTGSIEIPDIEPEVIKEMLQYIYTGKLPDEMTVEQASRLYEAGDKYNLRSLVAECGSYLGSSLYRDNVCNVLVLADNHSDSDLKKRAIDFISAAEIPLDANIWKKFRHEYPKLALETVEFAYEFLKRKTSLK